MVALSITQEVKESNVSEMRYDPKRGTFYVEKGWRSWRCVTTLSSYVITLVVMAWYAIFGLLAAIPFIAMAIVLGFVMYLILGKYR